MGKHNSFTLVIGKSGMGKSWFEGFLAEHSNKQRVILDPKDEHIGLAETHLVINRNVMAAVMDLPEQWTDFFRRVLATGKSVRITPVGLDFTETLAMVDGLARAMHERGNLFFLAGEYHRFAPNRSVPKWIQILHTDARTKQIDGIISSQRVALLDTTVASQANRRVTFKMDDVNDLARASSYFSNPDPKRFRRVEDAISSLPPRTCIYINADTSEQTVVQTERLTRRVQHHG